MAENVDTNMQVVAAVVPPAAKIKEVSPLKYFEDPRAMDTTEKSATFPEVEVSDKAHNSSKGTPEVTTETDYTYFDEMQAQPMTTEDMVKFALLVGFPTVFFVIACVLMHVYND